MQLLDSVGVQHVLGQLRRNESALEKSLTQAASGTKIRSAADGR